jgi:hypothetical protein
LVCGDGPDRVDKPGVVSQVVDFLSRAVDAEFAVVFDEGSTPQIKRSKAVVHNVCLQNGVSLREKCFS